MATDFKKFGASGEKRDTFTFDPDVLVIAEDPQDPLFASDWNKPLPKTFIDNIAAVGQIEPITAVRRKVDGKDIIVVEVGRSRTRALRIINKDLRAKGEPIRLAEVKIVPESKFSAGRVEAENAARKVRDPMEKADAWFRLKTVHNYSDEDIATVANTTTVTVKKHLDLLDLHQKVQQAVAERKLAVDTAQKFKGLSDEQQLETLEKILAAGAKGAEAEELLDEAREAAEANEDTVSEEDGKSGKPGKPKASGGKNKMLPKRQLSRFMGALEEQRDNRDVRFAKAMVEYFATSNVKALAEFETIAELAKAAKKAKS